MFFSYIRKCIGIIKLLVYKLIYFKRIKFKQIVKIDNGFDFFIDKNAKVYFGRNCKVRKNFSIKAKENGCVAIGDDVFFNENISINCREKIEIGNDCLFGPNVIIYDHDHDYKNDIKRFVTEPVVIEDNVWIGTNVTILKGTRIGKNSIVAAGTLVNKDVKPNSFVYQKRELVIRDR